MRVNETPQPPADAAVPTRFRFAGQAQLLATVRLLTLLRTIDELARHEAHGARTAAQIGIAHDEQCQRLLHRWRHEVVSALNAAR